MALVLTAFFGGKRKVPILLDPRFSSFADFKPVPGHQLVNPSIECFRSGKITEGQILRQNLPVKFRTDFRVSEQRLDFRAEEKGLRRKAIIQRLDSQAIPRRK